VQEDSPVFPGRDIKERRVIMNTGLNDPVALGSIAAVIVCIVIFVYLIKKIGTLMKKDEEAHKEGRKGP
jgi:hypothetical protein